MAPTTQAAGTAPNIVGGNPSAMWPSVGLLLDLDVGGCTGFLVSPTWVLTSAICAEQLSLPQTRFIVGPDSFAASATSFQVVQRILHPQYVYEQLSYNVALVRLNSSVPATPFIINDLEESSAFLRRFALGYGAINGLGDGAFIKRIGISRVGSGTPYGATPDQVFFTEGNPQCFGDAGGPNFDYSEKGFPIAFAVMSVGFDMCTFPSVSTRTRFVADFIAETVSGACFASAPNAAPCDGLFRADFENPLNTPDANSPDEIE